MFPAYLVEAQAPGFKANTAKREINILALQKHEPRQLQSGMGLVLHGAVNSNSTHTRSPALTA